MKGWVYIASNESMKGIVKIGCTSKDPSNRMQELSNTSVPTPFICEYSALVADHEKVEKALHDYFSKYRIKDNREFFNLETEMIVMRLREFTKIYYEDSIRICNQRIEEINILNQNKLKEKRKEIQQEQLKDAEKNAISCINYLSYMAHDFAYCKEQINKILEKRNVSIEYYDPKKVNSNAKYKYSFKTPSTIFHSIKPKDNRMYGLTNYESGNIFISELGGFFKNKYKLGFGVCAHHSGDLVIGCHNETNGLEGHGLYMERDKGIFLGKWSKHKKISGVFLYGNEAKLQVFTNGKLSLESNSNITTLIDVYHYIRKPLSAKL